MYSTIEDYLSQREIVMHSYLVGITPSGSVVASRYLNSVFDINQSPPLETSISVVISKPFFLSVCFM